MQLDVPHIESLWAKPRDARSADDTYALLAAPFPPNEIMMDTRGGATFSYVTTEAVITRLNLVLGPAGWSFRVLEHGINDSADEVWALGELDALIAGSHVVRQQFGSQKLRRSKQTGMILDIGFDLKGACSDSLKKVSSMIGVGLWLAHKEANPDGSPRRVEVTERVQPVQRVAPPTRALPPPPSAAHVASPPVRPAPPEVKPTDKQPETKQPLDPNEVIRSAEHPVVQRLVILKNQAIEAGLQPPVFKLPATRAELLRAGIALKAELDKTRPPATVGR